MSDDATRADADLREIASLSARVLEWQDCYDRLLGAFELHMDVLACKRALADLAGGYYDVIVGELHSEVDCLQAELVAARTALDQIDRHVVGACDSGMPNFPEPCEECGEMREIASQALQAMKKARSA